MLADEQPEQEGRVDGDQSGCSKSAHGKGKEGFLLQTDQPTDLLLQCGGGGGGGESPFTDQGREARAIRMMSEFEAVKSLS